MARGSRRDDDRVDARRDGMTILQVDYFLAAVAAGSLTQAAVDLGVAQPTLSEQIRKLEARSASPVRRGPSRG